MAPNPVDTCKRCFRARFDIRKGMPRHAAVVRCPACSSYLRPRGRGSAPHRSRPSSSSSSSPASTATSPASGPRSPARNSSAPSPTPSASGSSSASAARSSTAPPCSSSTWSSSPSTTASATPAAGPGSAPTGAPPSCSCRCGSARRTAARSCASTGAAPRSRPSAWTPAPGGSTSTSRRATTPRASSASSRRPRPPASALSTAAHLVSHGNMSNSCSFKHAIAVELCPICRDDLIFLPREASRGLGGLGRPLVLCVQVTSQIRLLDINNMRVVVLGIKDYDRYRFEPMLTSRRLVEYVVLADHVEHDDPSGHVPVIGSGYAVTWVQVARASDLGKNDTVFTVKTHIGYQLEPGDRALGYDLCSVNSNNQDLESYNGQSHKLPDLVLVKKTYNYKKGAGKMEIQDGSERGCAEIEKLAMGMGRMDLNQSDEKELDELLENLTI